MLKIINLAYRFNSKMLIENVSLDFHPGKISGIIGPNGSGKSTLLKSMCGIWQASHGEVMWKGQSLLKLSRKSLSEIITLVPQNPHIAFDFTTEEMILMAQHLQPASNRESLSWILESTNLLELRHRPITQLSSGERQRVYIARAIATGAQILLLDEPTSSLDLQHQLTVWRLLKDLSERGKTIIVTLHDLHAAKKNCQNVAVMCKGRCLLQGSYNASVTPEIMQSVFGVELSEMS